MDFGEALKALKAGKRVARLGWNGNRMSFPENSMWLVLVKPQPRMREHSGVTYLVRVPVPNPPPLLQELADWLLADTESGSVRALPWIGMKTADEGFVPWLASQTDMLAEDWSEV